MVDNIQLIGRIGLSRVKSYDYSSVFVKIYVFQFYHKIHGLSSKQMSLIDVMTTYSPRQFLFPYPVFSNKCQNTMIQLRITRFESCDFIIALFDQAQLVANNNSMYKIKYLQKQGISTFLRCHTIIFGVQMLLSAADYGH